MPIHRAPPPIEDDFNETEMFPPTRNAMPPKVPPMRGAAPRPPEANPLAKYFRTPGLVVRLPTNGAFLPEGAIEFTMSGEVEVWPMRTADELLLKSPDALMSGYAVEKLLQSCVPSIRAPRQISQPDLDVLLLAIRAATMGETMDVNAACPSCGTENTLPVHLPSVLGSMKPVPEEIAVRLSDEVMAYLRPFNLDEATKIALASFEEARKLQAIEMDANADPMARSQQMNRSFERLAGLNITVMAACVIAVMTPEGAVNDPRAIGEFVSNIPSNWFHKIESRLKEINDLGVDKKLHITCAKCSHEWHTDLEFNPSTFFG